MANAVFPSPTLSASPLPGAAVLPSFPVFFFEALSLFAALAFTLWFTRKTHKLWVLLALGLVLLALFGPWGSVGYILAIAWRMR